MVMAFRAHGEVHESHFRYRGVLIQPLSVAISASEVTRNVSYMVLRLLRFGHLNGT